MWTPVIQFKANLDSSPILDSETAQITGNFHSKTNHPNFLSSNPDRPGLLDLKGMNFEFGHPFESTYTC